MVLPIAGLIAVAIREIAQPLLERIPDPGERARAAEALAVHAADRAAALESAASRIVLAEAGSEHRLAAIWRPLLMLTVTAIVANNYVVAPYLDAVFGIGLRLDLPERLWDLLTVGVGGYVVGRSAEKVVRTWQTPPAG